MGCPEQFVPDQIKNQRLQPFLPPPRDRSQSRPTQGGRKSILRTRNKRDPIRPQGQPTASKNQKDFGTVESLNFFKELCNIEENLSIVFNKLNDVYYINGIANLSSQTLTKSETSVLSKRLGFCPTPGLQTLVILSRIWMFSKEKQD